MKNKKKKLIYIAVFIAVLFWILNIDVQKDLPHKIVGTERLNILERCQKEADDRLALYREHFPGILLDKRSDGYSERQGFCYVEFYETFTNIPGEDDSSFVKVLDLTNDKEIIINGWPYEAGDHERDVRMVIYGEYKVLDVVRSIF